MEILSTLFKSLNFKVKWQIVKPERFYLGPLYIGLQRGRAILDPAL
jgi:hypothetical protein